MQQNLTVVAMWSNPECLHCDLEIYTMYKMVYLFMDYENVVLVDSLHCS